MKSVLIIDDDDELRALIARLLQEYGWRVLEAQDGETGLNLARLHRPAVVLCDLLMPRCNGFQVCRLIRADPKLSATRIIVTSGRGYATDRLNAFEAGADEYLIKPVNPEKLRSVLSALAGDDVLSDAAPTTATPCESPTRVRFWGVRGSIPTPGPCTVFYGGNTACVEVRAENEIIILDAGTGIRRLGLELEREFGQQPINLTLLITHTHWDHIQGFPFFSPAYNENNRVRVLGFQDVRQDLEKALSTQMDGVYFPVFLEKLPASITIEEPKGMEFDVGKVKVKAFWAHHPGVCVGYRLFTSCGSIAFFPDNEPFAAAHLHRKKADGDAARDAAHADAEQQKLVQFLKGVDVLIIDSQYDAAEYETHVGWGHGCVEDVVALAHEAAAKQLFLFHHDPAHDDEKVSRMLAHARTLAAAKQGHMIVEAAREGLEVVLLRPTG